jgi:hypothetical protein
MSRAFFGMTSVALVSPVMPVQTALRAYFRRDRMHETVRRLGKRLREVKAQEEQSRRRAAYDAALVERDKLAAELAEGLSAACRETGRSRRASRRLHAGCRLGSLSTSPKLIPEEWQPPGFGIV